MAKLRGKYFFSPTDEFKDLKLSDFAYIVDAFEHRISGWFFTPIEQLLSDQKSDQKNLFAVTALECMLVDAFAGFWFGVEATTNWHFKNFLIKRMNINHQEANEFYNRFRNGILHQTNIKGRSCISDEVENLRLENGVLFFNPEAFYERLCKYFNTYLNELKSNSSCVNNFKRRFYFLFRDEFSRIKWKLGGYIPLPPRVRWK